MKKHLPVIIALGVPVLFILGVIAFLLIPPLFVSPQYDFVFASQQGAFEIDRNGQIVRNEEEIERIKERWFNVTESNIYLSRYHIETDMTERLTLEEAQELIIDNNPVSPDGFEVEYRRGSYNIFQGLAGGTPQRGYYASRGTVSQKLSLETDYFGRSFEFIGWIIEN